jgi:hypothetical protein
MPINLTTGLELGLTGSTSSTKLVEEIHFMPSTLETIDRAVFSFIDEKMNIYSTTNKGWKKTPVIWLSAERSHQIKNNKDLRDMSGSFVLPAITVARTSVTKDPTKKGIFWANTPAMPDAKGGSITISKIINQDKTQNFANAASARNPVFGSADIRNRNRRKANTKVVYSIASIPMPVYLSLKYTITLRTEYQQQMNELLTPFVTRPGGINYVSLTRDGHLYEAMIQQDFTQDHNVTSAAAEERKYQTKITIDVLGYVIGEGDNQKNPKITIRENAVAVKIPRERVISRDEMEHLGKEGFYRS